MSFHSKKQTAQKWEAYVKNLRRETPVPVETEAEKHKRIKKLLGNFEKFCQYYFPNYCTAPFADWQKKGAKKIIDNEVIYAVRAIAREHAKSVIYGLFLPLFEKFNGRLHNMILVSHSYDNAEELLMPIMLNLESNQRIINDYSKQRSFRGWETGRFVTSDNCSFRALGAGQSPRGSRNEEKRPDFILIDDIDTDEESRNQTRINNKWKWVEQALFPALSISGRKRFIFVGNIISKESVIIKAIEKADDVQRINILDKNGNPSWKERYKREDVNYMISKISYASAQKEYFNNPISEGTVFKTIKYGKVPPLNRFKFLIAYCDPSYKNSKKNDFKAIPLMGIYNGDLYVIKAYCEQTTIRKMINWFYYHKEYVNGKTTLYMYIEAGSLQDTFYQDIFLPRLRDVSKNKGEIISVSPDHRKKPDKFTRIEAALEPLNAQGRLIFNEKEKDDPHMKVLVEQFKCIEPSLPGHDDGPDAVEGGFIIANTKLKLLTPPKVGKTRRKKHKY